MDSRTCSTVVDQISKQLQIFSLAELFYVLQEDAHSPMLDVNRVKKITDAVRYKYGGKQSTDQVANSIKLLSGIFSQSFCMQNEMSLQSVYYRRSMNQIIIPFSNVCTICKQSLTDRDANQRTVKVYCTNGSVLIGMKTMIGVELLMFMIIFVIGLGTMLSLTCEHQSSNEHRLLPYAVMYPNFVVYDGKHIYYHDSLHAGLYVYVGGDVAVERGLIDRFSAEFIHHGISIHGTMNSLNQEAINTGNMQTSVVDAHALSDILYCYLIIQLDLCMGSPSVAVPDRVAEFHLWAWDQLPRLLSYFTYLWMNHATIIGPCNAHCSKCIVVDGHQKCRRRICAFKDVRIDTEELQQLVIGCCRTPISNSRYCGNHQGCTVDSDEVSPAINRKGKKSSHGRTTRSQAVSSTTKNKLNLTNCRTTKERSDDYVKKCHRSFGLIALVYNCRIIAGFSELFRSETLREIINLFAVCIRGTLSNIW